MWPFLPFIRSFSITWLKKNLLSLFRKLSPEKKILFLNCKANRVFFTDEQVKHYTLFTCSEVWKSLCFLLDYTMYVYICTLQEYSIYRQIIRIPMGKMCAPLIAYLSLYCYERALMYGLDTNSQADAIRRQPWYILVISVFQRAYHMRREQAMHFTTIFLSRTPKIKLLSTTCGFTKELATLTFSIDQNCQALVGVDQIAAVRQYAVDLVERLCYVLLKDKRQDNLFIDLFLNF